MKNLNINVVENLKVSLPPTRLQNKFAERVKEIIACEEKLEKSTASINILFSSLLSRAFTS
jgi:restriction endonuclease S subunit